VPVCPAKSTGNPWDGRQNDTLFSKERQAALTQMFESPCKDANFSHEIGEL